MGYDINITALERGVRTWVAALAKVGFTVEVEVFKTGPGGNSLYGPSTITLTIEKKYTDEYGNAQDFVDFVTFVAGGYGSLEDRNIGGREGWRAMKREALRRLQYPPGFLELDACEREDKT